MEGKAQQLIRAYNDAVHAGLALKGVWALVLVKVAKEKGNTNQLNVNLKVRMEGVDAEVNAMGRRPSRRRIKLPKTPENVSESRTGVATFFRWQMNRSLDSFCFYSLIV